MLCVKWGSGQHRSVAHCVCVDVCVCATITQCTSSPQWSNRATATVSHCGQPRGWQPSCQSDAVSMYVDAISPVCQPRPHHLLLPQRKHLFAPWPVVCSHAKRVSVTVESDVRTNPLQKLGKGEALVRVCLCVCLSTRGCRASAEKIGGGDVCPVWMGERGLEGG